MFRWFLGLPWLLWLSLAQAVEEEQPIEQSTMGIVVFVVVLVLCVVWFVWWMYKNQKKSEEERSGEKF